MGSTMDRLNRPLDDGYSAETQTMGKEAWAKVVEGFEDTPLMQTWPFGACRWGAENLSHVVLRKSGQIAAAAQVVIMKVPLLGNGIAYVKGGPLWHVRGKERDGQAFRMMIRALRETYAARRGFLLRIFPTAVVDSTGTLGRIFEEEGFKLNSTGTRSTVLIDLSYSVDELRMSLAKKWRYDLRLSERNGLSVSGGIEDRLFDTFLRLYKEMQARKKRPEIYDIDYYVAIQRDLPRALKMNVMLCEHKREPVAGIALSLFGDTALNLFAATGDKALQLRGSYFLYWHVIQWLKTNGYHWFDLNGINEKTAPGTSRFKARLAGALGKFTQYLGQFDACENRMSWCAVKVADRVDEARWWARVQLSEWLHPSTASSGES